MTVTRLEALTKTKYRVFLDDKPAFVLNRGELSKYGIEEGKELSAHGRASIMKAIVRRAELKAMRLLEITDRTEAELRGRLKREGYPREAEDTAIAYVKSYGYVDDMRYALDFVDRSKSFKSREDIYAILCNKGIAKETVGQAFEESYGEDDEIEAVKNLIRKKGVDPSSATREELGRLYAYLARKGFPYEVIRRAAQLLSQ